MAARYGGEEFAMILPETELSAAALIAEASREALTQLRIAHAKSSAAPYGSSSGALAVPPRRADMSAQQLLTDADQTLFQAKRLGRKRMVAVDAERNYSQDNSRRSSPYNTHSMTIGR